MPYYADLTPYTYDNAIMKDTLNVGWLDDKHPYPRGSVSEGVLDKVFLLCADRPQHRIRGWHGCRLCANRDWGLRVKRDDREILLGSAEIWVKGKSGAQYAAPDMIYHYMRDHEYLPPVEFIQAVNEQ